MGSEMCIRDSRLHDPAYVQQISSKLPANVFKIHVLIARRLLLYVIMDEPARCLLGVWWTFTGLCKYFIIECAVGEWRQRLPFAFVLEEDILSTCCNKDNVM